MCVHACTCICHSAIHTIFSISSESYFHQARLPCCPEDIQDTIERFHQFFKMFSKSLFFFFLIWMFATSYDMEFLCGKAPVLGGYSEALVLKC